MRRLEILWDMDGILADCLGPWLEWISDRRGKLAALADVTSWDMSENFPEVSNVGDCIHQPGYFANLEPLPGALDMVKALSEDGHKSIICSTPSRAPDSAADKLRWIAAHLPWVDIQRDVYLCGRKSRVRGDVFVDDSAANLRAYRRRHGGALLCTIDYPHNRSEVVDVRGHGWQDVAQACSEITQGIRAWAEREEDEW